MADLELLARVPPVPALAMRRPQMFGSEPLHDRRTSIRWLLFPFSLGRRPKFQLQPSICQNGGGIPGCSADLEGNETASQGLTRSRLSKGCELTRRGWHPHEPGNRPLGRPLSTGNGGSCWATPSCFFWTLWTEMRMGGVG